VTVNTEPPALAAQLLDVLRTLTSRPELRYSGEPRTLTGGFWAELVAFSLADPPPGWPCELVARVMPEPMVARKETIVQAAVAAAGFPTPAVRASGGPDAGLGRAFIVMDLAPGAPLLAGLDGGAALAAMRQVGQIPETLAATMARLHELYPSGVRERFSLDGDEPPTPLVLLGYLGAAAGRFGRSDLTAAARRLAELGRPPAEEVICHGDLHPFNLLVNAEHGERGQQITVLDWSASLLGPREHDLAFTTLLLSEPPMSVGGALRPVVRAVGRELARRFMRRYLHHAGVAVDRRELRWHRALICLRALVEVAGWAHEGVIGDHPGHPWLLNGPAMAARLGSVTGVRVRAR
jgi:aminoglycoside phosphotransferase (APT) family kinase protein